MKHLGIYIHIPFCRSKCPYCDFFSLVKTDTAAAYIEAVNCRLKQFQTGEYKADTLYIGGGTPSVLTGEQVASMIETVKKHYGTPAEITVECNPSDVDETFLRRIYTAGANRLSFGMQSAVDSERRALGRRADRVQVEKAVRLAADSGFANISLDLMLGIPHQTADSLHESICFCGSLPVQHISAYILKIEEGTYFGKHRDALTLPDEDATADLYLQAVEELEAAGFRQYEISNFAKPGYESRHNLKYWHLEEYLGIGAAAHSFVCGRRFYYERDIAGFIAGAEPVDDGAGGDREEAVMLALRLREGVETALLSDSARQKIPFLKAQGYVTELDGRVSFTPQGFLISNTLIAELTE